MAGGARLRVCVGIVSWLLAAGGARAQPPEAAGPPRVRLVFDEQQMSDALRARVYTLVADSVPRHAWPTVSVPASTSIATLLDRYYDIYTNGPGASPRTQEQLRAMIAEANPGLVSAAGANELAAGEVRLPPVPVRAFSDYRMTDVQARRFDPAEMSYVLRAPSGEVVRRPQTTLPTAADRALRRGAVTEVVLPLTDAVRTSLRTGGPAMLPLLALDDNAGDLATMTLLEAPAQPACATASEWITASPYYAAMQASLDQAAVAGIQAAAANLPLTIIDWNFGDPPGHGAKVRAVVAETLNTLGLGSLDPRVQTMEMNPRRNASGLRALLGAYKRYIVERGGADLAGLFATAEDWITRGGQGDEQAAEQRVPSLVLQAVFWSHFGRAQVLNFSFTTDSAALTVLDATFMPGARAFGALAAGNSGMPASPRLRPQAEAYQWENVVNVTHGRPDGTIDGDYSNAQFRVMVSLVAPGCGYGTPPIAPADIGSSFASPYVATAAWIRMLQGGTARDTRRALVAASVLAAAVGQKVESGGLFDAAQFVLRPGSHLVTRQGAYLPLSGLTFQLTYDHEGAEVSIRNAAAPEGAYAVAFHPCADPAQVCTTVRRWTSSGLSLTTGPVRAVSLDAQSGLQRLTAADPPAILALVRHMTF